MHDYPVILCEPFLHFLLPSGMMDKTDGRDRRMAQYYMLYKPRGLLTAKRDARRETVMSCFPEALREMLHPVGRLDRDTEGLLLFTDDGMLDVRLLRPEQHVEKEYEYRAFGLLDETAMRQLETGVLLLEGSRPSLPARAQLLAHTSIGESAPYLPERFREKYLKNPGPARHGRQALDHGRAQASGQADDQSRRRPCILLKTSRDRPRPAGRSAPPGRIPPVDGGRACRAYATGDQRRRYC